MTKAEAKRAAIEKTSRQKAHLFKVRFHIEVALDAAKKANLRKRLVQHLRIAHKGVQTDDRAAQRRLVKLGA